MVKVLSAVKAAPRTAVAASTAVLRTTTYPVRTALVSLFSRLKFLNAYGLFSSSESLRLIFFGLLATHGRTLLGYIQAIIEDRLICTFETSDRDEPFQWFESLTKNRQIGKNARNFVVADMREGEEELVAAGADVPLRTVLSATGSTSFLFSPKTAEVFSTWSDLFRVPDSYSSPLSLPAALHPLEAALLRVLPFTPYSTTLAWLNFRDTTRANREVKDLDVSTFSLTRSFAPLRSLVKLARKEYVQASIGNTSVYMPDSNRTGWAESYSRPRRSAEYVVLDDAKKAALFDDAKAFFDEENENWMAQRGLPFRRGYLLYGPPGNGKTSSVVALAGELDMDIYLLSLSDKNMDESALLRLTQQCSTPCILLLEDIDAIFTGRQREDEKPSVEEEEGQRSGRKSNSKSGAQLSFSSLLQVLDGAGSSEDRLLIMTTNHPEKLDPALIRPGRIDVRVCFENASRAQARDLFVRIFNDYGTEGGKTEAELRAEREREEAADRARFGGGRRGVFRSSSSSGSLFIPNHTEAPAMTAARLHGLADQFAAQVPDDRSFSMATLQGFLIRQALRMDRFGDLAGAAEDAVAKFPRWRDRWLAAARTQQTDSSAGGGASSTAAAPMLDDEDETAYSL
ncbi:hypothetical protein OC861_002203 [Tilletia horrida]|nr:hypothetical protein OC845_002037 [Tilletia horrida]KAK0568184.1 hypothetical protein OC861_002203 [Tilletia horrida]